MYEVEEEDRMVHVEVTEDAFCLLVYQLDLADKMIQEVRANMGKFLDEMRKNELDFARNQGRIERIPYAPGYDKHESST